MEKIKIDESGLAKSPDLAKILDLFNAQTSAVNTLWNIFIGVNLAIIGFLYNKDLKLGGDWKIKVGFTIGFLIFAFANQAAIVSSHEIRYAISKFLKNLTEESPSRVQPILLAHRVVPTSKIRNAHLAFTIMVALVMWSPDIANLLKR